MDSCFPIAVITKPCPQQEVYRVCVTPHISQRNGSLRVKLFGVDLYIATRKCEEKKQFFFGGAYPLNVLTLLL